MFASLLRNIAITGVAYGIVAGVGLALAPILIGFYGLSGYGQILLARVFLPTGFFALVDLGLAETATRQVAAAREDKRWDDCSAALTLLAVMALAAGALIGVALFAGADAVTRWFDIAADQREGFARVLRLTAVIQPALLLSLVAEGVLKGFERFEILRSIEVLGAILFGASAVAVGFSDFGPNAVAVALLGTLLVRLAIALSFAFLLLAQAGARPRRWSPEVRVEVLRWTATMLSAKVIGTMQNQLASPLIGILFNPAAVGLYDAVVRLPRFARSTFGLVSATVLPLASRLRSSDDHAATGRLAYYGILGASVASMPVAIACAVFSQPILAGWINTEVAQFWVWQSVMFAVTMLAVPISFGNSIALADRSTTRRLVRITAAQVVVQLALALLLADRLEQWAFVLAQVVAVSATFPLQYRILRGALFIERNLLAKLLVVVAASMMPPLALAALHEPGTVLELALQLALAAGLGIALSALLVLNRAERAEIFAFARRLGRAPA